MAAVEKFQAAEQDADICIYVRSSETNFISPFTEYMHRAVLQPAKEDKLRNVLRSLNTEDSWGASTF